MNTVYSQHQVRTNLINIASSPIAALVLILVGAASSTQMQFESLSQFIKNHTEQYKLIPISENILNNESKIFLPIYLYNSILYTQICYSTEKKETVQSFLPSMLIKRSYSPLRSASIMCYQIYDKLLLTQEPNYIAPQLNNPSGKSNGKQISYLQAEYQLLHWIYRFGTQINKKLLTNKLSLTKINKFSILVSLTQSDESFLQILQGWRSEDHEQRNMQRNRIQKKLSGKGFHQNVLYNVKIKDKTSEMDINSQQCEIQIIQTLPHNTYIDIDELRGYGYGLQTYHDANINEESFIDLEKPAYSSQQYQYRLRIPLADWDNAGVDEYQIKIPVHFRYPTPYHLQTSSSKTSHAKTSGSSNHQYPNSNRNQKVSQTIDFVQVNMYPTTKSIIICYPESLRKLVNRNKLNSCEANVYPLQEQYLSDSGTANVPVGDGFLKSIVNVVTLGSEVICAVLLVKMLRK